MERPGIIVFATCPKLYFEYGEETRWHHLTYRHWYDKPEKYQNNRYDFYCVYKEYSPGNYQRIMTLNELVNRLKNKENDPKFWADHIDIVNNMIEFPEMVTIDDFECTLSKFDCNMRECCSSECE